MHPFPHTPARSRPRWCRLLGSPVCDGFREEGAVGFEARVGASVFLVFLLGFAVADLCGSHHMTQNPQLGRVGEIGLEKWQGRRQFCRHEGSHNPNTHMEQSG